MTYAAAQTILKAPRFGDPQAIEARDYVSAVDRAWILLVSFPACSWCDGKGTEWNQRERCRDLCRCCFGSSISTEYATQNFADTWEGFTQEVRDEAIRIARARRKVRSR